ncbi:MAG: AbrB family transcriptional regulator [Actinobacteria bacterium]|nr:AbrB family transcriptional regulator [Actinomycetota bacterium]
MGEHTVLTRAASKSNSLRTTVPIFIVKQFDLSEGDMLEWELHVINGELVIIARPVKRGEKSGNEKAHQ